MLPTTTLQNVAAPVAMPTFSQAGIAGLNGGYAYPPGSSMATFMDSINSSVATAARMPDGSSIISWAYGLQAQAEARKQAQMQAAAQAAAQAAEAQATLSDSIGQMMQMLMTMIQEFTEKQQAKAQADAEVEAQAETEAV